MRYDRMRHNVMTLFHDVFFRDTIMTHFSSFGYQIFYQKLIVFQTLPEYVGRQLVVLIVVGVKWLAAYYWNPDEE